MRGISVKAFAWAEGVEPPAILKRVRTGRLTAVLCAGRRPNRRRLIIPAAALDDRLLATLEKKGALREYEPLAARATAPAVPDDGELEVAATLALLEREPLARVDELPPGGAFFSAAEVAALVGSSERDVHLKAARAGWPSVELAPAGDHSKRRLFPLATLPADVQARLAEKERVARGTRAENGSSRDDLGARWAGLPTAARREALRRAYILKVSSEDYAPQAGRRPGRLAAFVAKWRAEHPQEKRLSLRSVYRWRAAFAAGGILALVPDWLSREGVRPSALTPATRDYIDLLYLDGNKPSVQWVTRRLVEKCRAMAWPIPSYSAVRRHILSLTDYEKAFHRDGKRKWAEKYVESVLRDYNSVEPNEWWCADHHQLDAAVVVRDANGAARATFPWLTAIQDVRSRVVVGWALAETPSGASINAALLRALKRFGVPDNIILDNGRDFAGKRFTGGASHRFRLKIREAEVAGVYRILGITTRFCLPANPQAKPVERWFGTLERDFVVALPGYRDRDVARRPETLAAELKGKDGLLTFAALEGELAGWLETWNATWTHAELGGRAPLAVWSDYFKTHVVRRVDENALHQIMLRADTRKVGRFGVRLDHIWYRADELMRLQGQEVTLRYDADDASRVYVYDARDRFVCTAARRGPRAPFAGDMTEYKRIQAIKKRESAAQRALNKARAERLGVAAPTLADRLGSRLPGGPVRVEPDLAELVPTPFDGLAAADLEPRGPGLVETTEPALADRALAALAEQRLNATADNDNPGDDLDEDICFRVI